MHALPFALLIVLQTHSAVEGKRYVDTIPSPNTCSTAENLRRGTWLSYDCPVNARCVPPIGGGTNGTCQCSFTDEMRVLDDKTGKCVPSASSYAYAVWWMVVIVPSALLAFHVIHTHKLLGSARPSLLGSVILIQILSNLFCTMHRSLLIIVTVTNLTQNLYSTVYTILLILVACYSLTVLFTLVVLGVLLTHLTYRSAALRHVSSTKMRRHAIIAAFSLGSFLLLGDVLLLGYGQYALSYAFMSLFSSCGWLLFHMLFIKTAKLASPENAFGMWSAPSATDAIFSRIHKFSVRLGLCLICYTFWALLYNIFWYVGRHERNDNLLGAGIAAVSILQFSTLTCGHAFTAFFLRFVVEDKRKSTVTQESRTTVRMFGWRRSTSKSPPTSQ